MQFTTLLYHENCVNIQTSNFVYNTVFSDLLFKYHYFYELLEYVLDLVPMNTKLRNFLSAKFSIAGCQKKLEIFILCLFVDVRRII